MKVCLPGFHKLIVGFGKWSYKLVVEINYIIHAVMADQCKIFVRFSRFDNLLDNKSKTKIFIHELLLQLCLWTLIYFLFLDNLDLSWFLFFFLLILDLGLLFFWVMSSSFRFFFTWYTCKFRSNLIKRDILWLLWEKWRYCEKVWVIFILNPNLLFTSISVWMINFIEILW